MFNDDHCSDAAVSSEANLRPTGVVHYLERVKRVILYAWNIHVTPPFPSL